MERKDTNLYDSASRTNEFSAPLPALVITKGSENTVERDVIYSGGERTRHLKIMKRDPEGKRVPGADRRKSGSIERAEEDLKTLGMRRSEDNIARCVRM